MAAASAGAAAGFGDPLVAAGVVGLGRHFGAGADRVLDATRLYLDRIERHNPALNAFIDIDRRSALTAAAASAARWARGASLSPLDGVPIGVKANIAVRGLPWTGGLATHRLRIASFDASCVARLRDAGAVLLGTLAMDEGALGATGDNPWFGRTHNPHRLGHSPGGSSAGSAAAVAAGLCAAALGTDTMGSVRIPAAYCGVVGHSPRRGAIDGRGVVPLSWTFDNLGVLARSVADAACVLAALSRDPLPTSRTGLPLHLPLAALIVPDPPSLDDATAAACAQGLEAARTSGLLVRPLKLSDWEPARAIHDLLRVVEAEGWAEHAALLSEQPEGYSPGLRQMLEWGGSQPAGRLALACRSLRATGASIRAQMLSCCGLLTPTVPQRAHAFDGPAPRQQAAFTAIGSIAGLSSFSLPVWPGDGGLPAGLQVLAFEDGQAIELARRLEGRLPATRVPAAFAAGVPNSPLVDHHPEPAA